MLDALGLQPGWDVECADAETAYTQTILKGPKTWVRLPKWLQPESWAKYKDPVCVLYKDLYLFRFLKSPTIVMFQTL